MTASPQRPGLDYPLGTNMPTTGSVLEVAPGIHWIRMALPFALDHINLWLLRDQAADPSRPEHIREGWTVVDCGIDNPATREAWAQIETNVLQGLPVLRVLVTHMHPDHMGLAHWLCERWKAPLWMSTTEYQSAMLASSGMSNFGGDKTQEFFAHHGWTNPEHMTEVRARVNYYPGMVPRVPDAHRRLMDGNRIQIGTRSWRCIAGHGHSPEHMALLAEDESVLISGDMLLPSISTNVSVYALEPEGNALQLFLDSLTAMEHLSEKTLVLPSHGRPFRGAAARVHDLREHHRERLEDLLQACSAEGRTAHEVLPVLFKRPLNVHQTTFAMGEAVAHLNALWHQGKMLRRQGADGIYRFQTQRS